MADDSFVTSPFLAAHPEYRALLGRRGVDSRSFSDEEYGLITVLSEGRLVWSCGEVRLSDLFRSNPIIRFYHREGRSLRYTLFFRGFIRGRIYVSSSVIDPPARSVDGLGRSVVCVDPGDERYPRAVRIARHRAFGRKQSTKSLYGLVL